MSISIEKWSIWQCRSSATVWEAAMRNAGYRIQLTEEDSRPIQRVAFSKGSTKDHPNPPRVAIRPSLCSFIFAAPLRLLGRILLWAFQRTGVSLRKSCPV